MNTILFDRILNTSIYIKMYNNVSDKNHVSEQDPDHGFVFTALYLHTYMYMHGNIITYII